MNRLPPGRLSIEECQKVADNAGGRCAQCGALLGDGWASAHLPSHGLSGSTDGGAIEPWCMSCAKSYGDDHAIDIPGFSLREWQSQAMEVAMERIWKQGSATIHAAPGAGKTRFTGATFLRMRAAGWAERMVVVVPNSALRSQWRESLFDMGIKLDDEPRDNWQELRGTDGAVVTYHSLPKSAWAHQRELHHRSTLVVLDEVHHAGDKATWGRAVNHMVGDVSGEVDASGVLNLTGTLFRSTGSKRISTVQYRRSEADLTKFEAIEDYSVKTAQLVPQYLRPPNVYTYGADVRLLDTSTAEIVEGEIADLDAQQKTAVLREQWSSKSWVDGFAAEALRLLQLQQEVVGRGEPLKLLYVAANQQAAKRAADTLNQLTRSNFARLVISDEPSADRVLRRAAKERTSLAIVSVRMVTEGFDCPAVSTIAYASNVIADLTIAQTMARAMRITDTERQLSKVLPAQILIPDHPKLKASFSEALVGRMHLINDETDGLVGAGLGIGGAGPTMPRYQVVDLTGPVLRGATVVGAPDGEVLADELAEWNAQLTAVGVPLTYTPNIVVASRQIPQFPRIYSDHTSAPAEPALRSEADPRTLNKMHRQRITSLAGWMAKHLEHDDRWQNTGWFQNEANDYAGIPTGGRDRATETQLAATEAWMTEKIIQHCDAQGCLPPVVLTSEE